MEIIVLLVWNIALTMFAVFTIGALKTAIKSCLAIIKTLEKNGIDFEDQP